MIVAAAVCPHPPLLLHELTGLADVGRELRSVCTAAVRELAAAEPDEVVVVGGDATTVVHPAGSVLDVAGFGSWAAHHGPASAASLPASLGLGARLLDWAGWEGGTVLQGVGWHESPGACAALGARLRERAGRTALLVLGDASARRGPQSPGYVDPRATGFDERVTRALAAGDASALAGLDPVLADELLVQGRAAWQVLAGAVDDASPPVARLLHADDPFGVLYLVATWSWPGPAR